MWNLINNDDIMESDRRRAEEDLRLPEPPPPPDLALVQPRVELVLVEEQLGFKCLLGSRVLLL